MIGSVVGNFKILDKLGEGGMGAVYLAVDLMLDRRVAIKMLRPELARDPQVVERFRTEAVTLARINHPRVATLYSLFRERDGLFMAMEYVAGETLDHVISARGAMPPEGAVAILCQALVGIDHAHRMGIIHRDLKPGNLMLLADGSVKVMDFGIARVLGTSRMTRTGRLIGTVEYMSPEQVRGNETGAASDLYSLGIVLFEMLTGRVPFHADSEYELMRAQVEQTPTAPRTFAPGIPPLVEAAVLRALEKEPSARFASASEFRAVLLEAVGAVEPPARSIAAAAPMKPTRVAELTVMPPSVPAAHVGGPTTRRTIFSPDSKYWVGAAALLVIGAVIALWLVRSAPETRPASELRPSPAAEVQKPPESPAPTPVAPAPVAAPPSIHESPDVHAASEPGSADRERERRRAARRAAEKALDLR